MKDDDSKELIHKVKVTRNLIVLQAQMAPTVENRFSRKAMLDNIATLGATLTVMEKELQSRGIFVHD